MKAIVISEPGSAEVLRLEERPEPEPLDEEVIIRVFAAGVNRPDIAQRKGVYPAPTGAPQDIPGLEVAGTIDRCGPSVQRWKKGDKVCALLAGGGYAQLAKAHYSHCLPIPTNWTFAEAASLPETFFTVWHNVFQRGQLKPGEHFLVHGGTSGIGITAIQLAKAFGATVFATAGSEEKRQACLSLGASQCINYNQEDFESVLKSVGVDVILDMVGGEYIARNLRLLKVEGRLIFINAINGKEGHFNVSDIMQRRLTITGSTLRSREVSFKGSLAATLEKEVWPLLSDKKIKPVLYKQFPLVDASLAHILMESSTHIGKIVLVDFD